MKCYTICLKIPKIFLDYIEIVDIFKNHKLLYKAL